MRHKLHVDIIKMARILSLDYGTHRTGIATTDPQQIIATALTTVETPRLRDYLRDYFRREEVEKIVIGQTTRADGSASSLEPAIQTLIADLQKEFAYLQFDRHEEARTSLHAREIINFSVKSQKKRQDKGLIDRISALIILQEYLGFI